MANSPQDSYERMMSGLIPIDPTEALNRARSLIQTEPNYRKVGETSQVLPETLKWLGQLGALIDAMKLVKEGVDFSLAQRMLVSSRGSQGGAEIQAVLYRVLAHAEIRAPTAAQGAFVAAGEEVNAYGAIAKILESAQQNLLVVDPYLDATFVTDFLAATPEGVVINALADASSVKTTLLPAAQRWNGQFGDTRPLNVRLAPARSLHDRLIIVDETVVWSLTQSIKDFAKRAHAAVLKVDDETGRLKFEAYSLAWNGATPN
ncbi:phosphatidylserine/phosphatidylglycerophosphate/cardiolipin synthase family protein [Erythrobacter colymbi]|uniref:phosphatidylserine/phosphatidylglycerophosphate/ cardiolipin synthase family protein n=1 Tax=Erythrobacter colymbi TaxID=1161202 RepID=UPI0011812445|nr:phosphatidylserine/phosphatidylglycerophosphate/cardiolipin synthase family protein [Erythrobacter colymbi]